jgi:hypothetical protein
MESALKIASEQTKRTGHRARADGSLEADRVGRVGRRQKPGLVRGDGDGRRDRIAIGQGVRQARAGCSGGPTRHIQTNPTPVTARTDGGGRRGAWHQLGLLMGSCSWVASPQICVTGEEMLLAGTTRTTSAQRQTRCRVESSGARWAVAAGQLRAGRARRDAGKALGRDAMHLVRAAAGALPQAERRAPFEGRSSMTPI